MKKLILLAVLLFTLGSINFAQKLSAPEQAIQAQVIYGDGYHDDTKALNAWGSGKTVMYKGKILGNTLQNGTFLITWEVNFNRPHSIVRNNLFLIRYTGYDSIYILHFGRRVKHKHNQTVPEGD